MRRVLKILGSLGVVGVTSLGFTGCHVHPDTVCAYTRVSSNEAITRAFWHDTTGPHYNCESVTPTGYEKFWCVYELLKDKWDVVRDCMW